VENDYFKRVMEQDYKTNKKDVMWSLAINLFFVVVLIALYFANRANGFLDRLAEQF